jgi:hypothetical protein
MDTLGTGTLRNAVLAAMCALAAGCHSLHTVGSAAPRKETDTAVTAGPAAQAQVLLDPGVEVQWVALEKHRAAYLKAPTVRLRATVPADPMALAWRPARHIDPAVPLAPGEAVVVLAGDNNIRPVSWQSGGDTVAPAVRVVDRDSGDAGVNDQKNSIPESNGPSETKEPAGARNDIQAGPQETKDAAPVKSPRPIERFLNFFRGGKSGSQP